MFLDFWSDVRCAIRKLTSTPGFSLVVVSTLALSIAVNTTMFSVIDAILFQPMQARNPEQLVAIFSSSTESAPFKSSSFPDYLDIKDRTSNVLSGLAAYTLDTADLNLGARAQHIAVGFVSGNYFSVLGVQPYLGRAFLPKEDELSNPQPVAILSASLWRNEFGADPRIVGKPIRLNNQSFTVVGVLDDRYSRVRHFFHVDLFVPTSTKDLLFAQHNLASRDATQFFLLGRLAAGVQLPQAQAKLNVIAAEMQRQYPKIWTSERGRPATITVLRERDARVPPQARTGVMAFSLFLLVIVAMALFIACFNLASLSLARALGREKEIAVRIALGSTRFRLIRQLLSESLILSAIGTVAALVLTYWASKVLAAYRPPMEISLGLDLKIDYRVLLFTLFITLFTTVLFGLAPALHATRPDIVSALRDTVAAGGSRRFSLRKFLIVGEVATSFILLVPAGLFLRSLQTFEAFDLGFNRDHLALVAITLTPEKYSAARGQSALNDIVQRLETLPGVQQADFALTVPLSGVVNQAEYTGLGSQQEAPSIDTNIVGPHYFQVMGIPLVRGRNFDELNGGEVAVVNEALADSYWPHQDPIGKFFVNPATGKAIEIVGVVRTGKYHSVTEAATPMLYRPISQEYVSTVILHVRTVLQPETLLTAITREVASYDATLPVFAAKTMRQELAISVAPYEAIATLLCIFGGFGLILAFAGLYSLIAYQVRSRTREIGIRMALGARPSTILHMMTRQGMQLLGVGMGAAVPVAIAISFLIPRFLFGISPLDPWTLLGVPGLLTLMALAAMLIPARQAMDVQPAEALRAL